MAASLAIAAPAQAASWHGISGDTWSDSNKWYTSSTIRQKSGEGPVWIKFSRMPRFSSGTVDGIKWELIPVGASGTLTGKLVMYNEGTTYELHGGMANYKQFKNSFARTSTCTSNCGHGFAGEQLY
ncbi:hypothetical protein [Micromonospora zamorensis]|uniref:hypothetical protein n=1 Tax=Micromonospora zamorensis TaxID=709883 RepID=UPI0033DA4B24